MKGQGSHYRKLPWLEWRHLKADLDQIQTDVSLYRTIFYVLYAELFLCLEIEPVSAGTSIARLRRQETIPRRISTRGQRARRPVHRTFVASKK